MSFKGQYPPLNKRKYPKTLVWPIGIFKKRKTDPIRSSGWYDNKPEIDGQRNFVLLCINLIKVQNYKYGIQYIYILQCSGPNKVFSSNTYS